MRRVVPGLLLWMMVLGTGQMYALQTAAMISGTVRDVHGTPQMGALIELMRNDQGTIATAVSDDHGRFTAYVVPGEGAPGGCSRVSVAGSLLSAMTASYPAGDPLLPRGGRARQGI